MKMKIEINKNDLLELLMLLNIFDHDTYNCISLDMKICTIFAKEIINFAENGEKYFSDNKKVWTFVDNNISYTKTNHVVYLNFHDFNNYDIVAILFTYIDDFKDLKCVSLYSYDEYFYNAVNNFLSLE